MFADIRRFFGAIRVEQGTREISITGIPADAMQKDISKMWKTSRINSNMFTMASRSAISFPLFFAVDVLYMINQLIDNGKRLETNINTLTKIRDGLLEQTWLRGTQQTFSRRLKLEHLRNLVHKPLDFQQAFFEGYDQLTQQYNLRGYLLAATAGSGKTYTTLALAECLEANRVIVVCPKVALYRVWEMEIKGLYRKPQTYWIYNDGKPYQNERFLVVHYEALPHLLTMLDQVKTSNMTIVLDECHNLNDIGSKRTKEFIQLCDETRSRDIIWASGTAIKALGGEAIPLLRTIDPYFTADAEARFRKIYGRDGNRGVDILRERIGLISHKVEKEQLGLAKPDMKRYPVIMPTGKQYTLTAIRKDMERFIQERVKYYREREKADHAFYETCLSIAAAQMSKSEAKQFTQYKQWVVKIRRSGGDARYVGDEMKWANQFEKEVVMPRLGDSETRNRFKDVKSIYKYVNLKIQGEALGRVVGRKRIECHVDMVDYIDFIAICESTPKKTVVFTSFVEALEAASKRLSEIGLNPLTVYGKNTNELASTVRQFDKDKSLNPLVATFQSLSTAVPLVMADTILMINSPFRAYIHEQAISRIHRLGADTQTTVYEAYLDTGNEPNISTRATDILEWSQTQVELIMGIKSPFKMDEANGTVTVVAESLDIEEEYALLKLDAAAIGDLPAVLEW